MSKKSAKLYSIAEAAAKIGVTRQTLHFAIKHKKLNAVKSKFTVQKIVTVNRRGWCITEKDLAAYVVSEQHRDAGKKN